MNNMDKNYWMSLIDRWFEGETSDHEEESLRRFLASGAASDPCFDEVKAVMGFFAAGRMKGRKSRGNARILGWVSAAAAVVAVLVTVGVMSNGGTCVMWEDGKMITDRNEIIASAESSLTEIFSAGTDAEEELKNLFEIR